MFPKIIILLSFFISYLLTAQTAQALPLGQALSGQIVLQVEEHGEAWYINPENYARYYLPTPTDFIKKTFSPPLGISNTNLWKIPLSPSPATTTLPFLDPSELKNWWGRINTDQVPVMSASTQGQQLGTMDRSNRVKVLGRSEGNRQNGISLWYEIDGGAFPGAFINAQFISLIKQPTAPKNFQIPTDVTRDEYWIDVDLSRQVLTLFKYDQAELSTYISSGTTDYPTITGLYRVWLKLSKARMSGGPPLFSTPYDLADVPFTLYYNGSYGLHGTYWHDKFGSVQSHGCTNLTIGDAAYIFTRVTPTLPTNQNSIQSTTSRPGTLIFNHY